MISKWLSASEIAVFIESDKRVINRRAVNEHWVSRNQKARGGTHRLFQLAALPEDVQTAYAESLAINLNDLQSQLKPASMPDKKVILANHNARSGGQSDVPALEKASDKKRRIAKLRARVIHAWDESDLSAAEFVFEYNEGRAASEIKAELGGKSICQSTLYNWLAKYQKYDEAGLVPQYKERGGFGASLDKRTKELLWYYYLNKNKPSIAQVIRKLDEKEQIKITANIVYRYIQHEIPGSVKDYFRKGKKYFHDHYESYINIDYTRYRSMEMVVYDHKTLDFASRIQRADGWHRARLVLTCILDKRSRMILGWWVDEVPSTITIIRATRMMVEKYGCPDSGQFDNGKDFTSYWFTGDAWNEQHNKFGTKEKKTMSCVTEDLGMASHFTEPYHGQSKHIERHFGFFAIEFDKSFESYLGSNTSDRHDESRLYVGSFDGAPMRAIEELPTIEETRELFAKFAEWYNTKWKHTGQGMNGKTPDAVFKENLHGRRDLQAGWAKYVWTRREIKTVQRDGVSYEGGWYYNPAMQAITGQEVELRISIDDIGTAYIFNLAGEYLYEAVSEFKDSGITEENVRNARRLRKQAKKHLDEYQSAIAELRKDKKTQLEELRDNETGTAENISYEMLKAINSADADIPLTFETKMVVGGEPLAAVRQKRRLMLPTDPD
jgi:hypothetical protein